MNQKTKIQYVGQFYVYGSEARKLQPKEEVRPKPRTRLPLERLRNSEAIFIDPVALIGIVAALVLLVTMVTGLWQIREDWADYRTMSGYVEGLRKENARLSRAYRASYDLEEIRSKAIGLGLVPVEQVQTRTVKVTMPEPEAELTWTEELGIFWDGLWEGIPE